MNSFRMIAIAASVGVVSMAGAAANADCGYGGYGGGYDYGGCSGHGYGSYGYGGYDHSDYGYGGYEPDYGYGGYDYGHGYHDYHSSYGVYGSGRPRATVSRRQPVQPRTVAPASPPAVTRQPVPSVRTVPRTPPATTFRRESPSSGFPGSFSRTPNAGRSPSIGGGGNSGGGGGGSRIGGAGQVDGTPAARTNPVTGQLETGVIRNGQFFRR
ncbi:hypothetical protein Mal4_02420 [Maioricimonas rarisocia]|uniref:Translation initiation factor IF-2 n=1 Tax=Maioricimonas rarisocia TaxID=2528026 RepID=A0A517Z0L8_9PLAN|nr:hypothetical protein [Maioricimonas rarisocia]QDU35959.1 hypothetical protein Mal4_02420 [Maioricimonas rarisocia]